MKHQILGLFGLGIVSALLLMSQMTDSSKSNRDLFQQWKNQFQKNYQDQQEESYRFQIFQENLKLINGHNANQSQSFQMALNQFSDLKNHEFIEKFMSMNTPPLITLNESTTKWQATKKIDWIAENAVNQVRNQSECNAGYAFSSVGALESAIYLIGLGNLVSLSKQQVIDCSKSQGNQGCQSGSIDSAFKYIQASGLQTDAQYPFDGKDQDCKQTAKSFAMQSYKQVEAGDVEGLYNTLAKQPVAVSVDARLWQYYGTGVFHACQSQLTHSALLVGFDSEAQAWVVQNSWGTSWGEKGLIRLSAGNTCGIANGAFYPVIFT